jgi:hypothetical protein
VQWRLQYDACFGITAADAIVRIYLDEAVGDLLRAIGYYHSHTPALADTYRMQVVASAAHLFGGRRRR